MLILSPKQQELYEKLYAELEQIYQNAYRFMDTEHDLTVQIFEQQAQALANYAAQLPDHQCSCALLPPRNKKWTHTRRSLLKTIYPVGFYQTSLQPPWVRREIAENFKRYQRNGWLTSIQIFTQDHVMLDSLLIRQPQTVKHAPILLIAPGNGQTMEELFTDAQQYAQQYNIQVLLFNGRGINKSMGCMHSTQDAVRDCEAALLLATKLSTKIAIHGISLGGGLMATALERLHKTHKLKNNQVALVCFQHTFACLPTAAAALLAKSTKTLKNRVKIRSLAWLIGCSLDVLGYNKLKTARVLKRTQIAHEVLVTYAKDDPVIRYGARLQDFLRPQKNLANKICYIENNTSNHMEYNLTNQHVLFDEAMRRFAFINETRIN